MDWFVSFVKRNERAIVAGMHAFFYIFMAFVVFVCILAGYYAMHPHGQGWLGALAGAVVGSCLAVAIMRH
ncbi:MAG: hypothetical protein UY31_C0052G0003 [Candidatus Wolfebacteria bacterium GW2011_GWE1_48_7]|nr:MAG: hypothetical protein UY31_C0052G0003 [Candidatus Wolfebacteria bacterium GW2011_GWE1_48_7]